jgi:hypothetical protein
LLTSPVSCLLTDPGSLCPGDMTTLACNITGGQAQLWLYNNNYSSWDAHCSCIARSTSSTTDGGWCRISTVIAVQITFVAAQNMNGRIVECRTSIRDDRGATITVPETTTLRVGSS